MANIKIRHALKQENLNRKLEGKNPDSSFIPFVCHFDPKTILTKNGELLQVIRVVGFNFESIDSDLVNLRESVRDSIAKNVKTNNFAIWLHKVIMNKLNYCNLKVQE